MEFHETASQHGRMRSGLRTAQALNRLVSPFSVSDLLTVSDLLLWRTRDEDA
jgi:hypothetical protein